MPRRSFVREPTHFTPQSVPPCPRLESGEGPVEAFFPARACARAPTPPWDTVRKATETRNRRNSFASLNSGITEQRLSDLALDRIRSNRIDACTSTFSPLRLCETSRRVRYSRIVGTAPAARTVSLTTQAHPLPLCSRTPEGPRALPRVFPSEPDPDCARLRGRERLGGGAMAEATRSPAGTEGAAGKREAGAPWVVRARARARGEEKDRSARACACEGRSRGRVRLSS